MNLAEAFAGLDCPEGIFTLSGGEEGHTEARRNEDGSYDIRYESGWWVTYRNDGVRPIAGYVLHQNGSRTPVPGGDKRNVVAFEPVSFEEACRRGVAMGFRP